MALSRSWRVRGDSFAFVMSRWPELFSEDAEKPRVTISHRPTSGANAGDRFPPSLQVRLPGVGLHLRREPLARLPRLGHFPGSRPDAGADAGEEGGSERGGLDHARPLDGRLQEVGL